MFETFGNKIIFFGLFAGFIAIRGIFGLIAKQSGLTSTFENEASPKQKSQKSNSIGIIIVLGVLALLVLYAVWPEYRDILIVPFPDWVHWLGMALGIISLALQVWIHATLQKNWSAARESGRNNVVITSGPYSRIRHPLYVALMLLLVRLSFVSGFSLFLLLTFLAIPFIHNTARKEEAMLVQQFGDEYRSYMKCTGRFFPGHIRTR